MKKLIQYTALLLLTFTFSLSTAFAQAPEKMSYQAVIRDASNNLVISQSVGMQISILQTDANGTAVYAETQNPTTNANGLVSLEIGTGTVVSGDFTTIDWASDIYFIKTETDPAGGTDYTITGTSQLLSVPYALHSKTAESITGTISETDPVFGTSVAGGITSSDISNWNNHTVDTDTHIDSVGIAGLGYVAGGHTVDTDTHIDSAGIAALGFNAGGITTEVDGSVTNEIQTISKPGPSPVVYLSKGGGSFIDAVNDADADPLNELQTVSKTLDIVTLSNTGGSFSVNDADADPLNELQDISLSGNSLSISDGSTVNLSGVGFDGDFNSLTNVPVNLDTDFTDDFDGQYSSLTGAPTNVSIFTNDAGYLTSFTETDPVFGASPAFNVTNTLMTNWSTAYTWGNHATQGYLTSEVDGSVSNEIQTLSVSGNNLTISGTGGNTVTLPSGSSLWTLNGSDIYRNSRVGIGTSTPATVMEVADNFPIFTLRDNDNLETEGNFQSYLQGIDMAGTETWYVGEGSTGQLVGLMASRPNYDLFLGTNSIVQMTVKSDGKIGMNTITPLTTLDVNGDIRGTKFVLGSTNIAGNHLHTNFNTNGTDVDISYGTGWLTFMPNPGNVAFALDNNGNTIMGLGTNNVGIGTAVPSEKLEIKNGSLKIVDGTEGAGKVLTSDANGKGAWTKPVDNVISTGGIASGVGLPIGANCPVGGSYTSPNSVNLEPGVYMYMLYSCANQIGQSGTGFNMEIIFNSGTGDASSTWHDFNAGNTCEHYYTGVIRVTSTSNVTMKYTSTSGSSFTVPGTNTEYVTFVRIN